MSGTTNNPDWLDQVQKFETEDQLAATQRADVTHDPVMVGASLGAIADGLEAEAAQSAVQEEAVIGDKVVVLGAQLAAARAALFGIAKTFDDHELRGRALEAYEATQASAPASAAAGDEVVIGGQVYVRAGGFKKMADGRNLPVFIAEGHPDERELGASSAAVTLVRQQSDAVNELLYEVADAIGKGDVAEAQRGLAVIRETIFSSAEGLTRSVLLSLMHLEQAKLDAGAVIKKWICDHEAELGATEFARIDASLERLVMHLGLALASKRAPASGSVYRLLNRGERILATDQCLDDDYRGWTPVGNSLFAGMEFIGMKPVRRALDTAPAAAKSAVEDVPLTVPAEFLAICEEELVRGTLTSLPLKLRFGASRGMSTDEVQDWMRATRQAFVAAVQAAAAQKSPKAEPAPRYLVMHGVENSSTKHHPLPDEAVGRKIHQVWRLLDERAFLRAGKPSHHGNAFLDDISHDWAMTRDGKHIRYFAHSSEKGDVVSIILEFEA